jgi:hypothetical protein
MGIFGLGSFGEGLVKGLAESATVSLKDEMERIENSIKTASDIRLKRIVQDQDKRRNEAEKVVKALKRARATLGGVDNEQAAIRAASLLKQQGDLDAFNTLIGKISGQAESGKLDFNKYFGDVSKMAPAASDLDIAYSFVNDATLPLPDSKEGLKGVEPKGILKYLGPDIDAQSLVEERTQQQMAMMDLGVRDVKDISIPTVEFKSEAFKLDGFTADQEFQYLNDKLAKGNLTDKQRTFYSERTNSLAGSLGVDKQLELVVNKYNSTDNADEKAKLEQDIIRLGKTNSRLTAMKTGSTLEVLKIDYQDALEKSDFKTAASLNKKMLDSGAITLDTYMSRLQTVAASGGEGADAAGAEAVKIGTVVAKLKQDIGNATKFVTFDGMSSVDSKARQLAMRIVKDDATLLAKGIRIKTDSLGNLSIDAANSTTDAEATEAFNAAFDKALSKVYEDFAKRPDSSKDIDFVAAHEAFKAGVDIKPKDTGAGQRPKVAINEAQINSIKSRPDTAEGGAAYLAAAEQSAAAKNRPVNKEALVDAARQAGKSDAFIEAIIPTMTPDVRSLVAQGVDKEAAAFEAGIPTQPSPVLGIERTISDAIDAKKDRNTIVTELSRDKTMLAEYGSPYDIGKIVDRIIAAKEKSSFSDYESKAAVEQAKKAKAAAEIKKKLSIMSKR